MLRSISFTHYKQLCPLFLIALLPLVLLAQNPIPNAGFETWAGGNPSGWITTNVPGLVTPVTQSGNSHTGNFAAHLEVVDFQGTPVYPSLQTLDFGFPVSQAYTNLQGYYQFNPAAPSNVLYVFIYPRKNGIPIGAGIAILTPTQTSYTSFDVPISYNSGEVPDTAWIVISLIDTLSSTVTGSIALIDDLELSGSATGIVGNGNAVVSQYILEQNFPNPFNPSTTIEFFLPETVPVQLTIFNQLGEQVASLINHNLLAGVHRFEWQAGDLPSGIYYYKLNAGNFSNTKKLILLK